MTQIAKGKYVTSTEISDRIWSEINDLNITLSPFPKSEAQTRTFSFLLTVSSNYPCTRMNSVCGVPQSIAGNTSEKEPDNAQNKYHARLWTNRLYRDDFSNQRFLSPKQKKNAIFPKSVVFLNLKKRKNVLSPFKKSPEASSCFSPCSPPFL